MKEGVPTTPKENPEAVSDLFNRRFTELAKLGSERSKNEIGQSISSEMPKELPDPHEPPKEIPHIKHAVPSKNNHHFNELISDHQEQKNQKEYHKVETVKAKKLEELQEIAEKRGGKCLSSEYINSETKLKFQCKEGHIWENTYGHIKGGQWCHRCGTKETGANRRLKIESIQEIALQRGGTCLSPDYVNNYTKLKFQCKEGHIWEAVPKTIKKGNWCPKCADNQKLTIEEMQELAEQRGGKCLSTEYINTLPN